MIRPNHSPELERLILMSLMHIADHTDSRVQKAMMKLSADCFYNYLNAELFALINICFKKSEPFGLVDILVRIPQSKKELHNAHALIMDEHTQIFTGTSGFENYVDRLIGLRILRKQMELVSELIKKVSEISDANLAQECLVEHINRISNLSFRESKDGISNIELAEKYYDGELPNDLIIPTTCDQLNDLLCGGVMAKSLITIAAGAGVGKTGFAIWLMDAIARNQLDLHSLFFSLEMESRHIWMRHVGICAGKQFDKLNDEERMSAVTKSVMVPVKIYDSASTRMCSDIDFILTTSRLKAMEKPISVIVVDYLSLVQNRGTFERNDLKQADITTKLANLAMELNCVVIALSQINRSASGRAKDDQCPYPSDAADSSGSHRSSTLWLGVDRPELYQDDPAYKNQFVIKCRKNRFGGIFEQILAFNDGTFAEVPYNWFPKPSSTSRNHDKALFSDVRQSFYERE